MNQHNFKIGDKVRIVHYPSPRRVGQIAIINTIYPQGCKFQYCISIGDYWVASVREAEIEPAVKVGEQLMFSFMKE